MKDLEGYCERVYGKKAGQMSKDELWDIVCVVGPFVVGGPQREKSAYAKSIQDQALTRIQEILDA